DVAQARTGFDLGDAEVEATSGCFRDAFCLFGRLTEVEGRRGVAVETVEDVSDIDVDDVAFLQAFGARDPVAHDVIDGGAHALGEAVVVEGRRNRPLLERVFVYEGVDLLGCYTGTQKLPHFAQGVGGEAAHRAHALDFACGFDGDGVGSKQHGWL